jgi:hypothetical protein
MKIGNDIYTIFKKNNTAVLAITGFAFAITAISLFITFKIYKESQQNIYSVNQKGELIPLVKLEEKKDQLKLVQANLDYFVSLYYDLDGYTMKDKKEKVFWLLGEQPTYILKDRDRKGYFNTFLSMTGLVQHAQIDQNSWQFSSYDAPYTVSFTADIIRINGNNKQYYKCEILATLEKTNRNYPYNPYGLIITNFSENLTKIEKYDNYEAEQKAEANNNQNN